MTLTDCVADEYNLYIGIELTAPKGTVLDWEGGYQFDEWSTPDILGWELYGSGHHQQVRDDDPQDNSIRFILWSSYMMREGQSLDGQKISLTLGGLFHLIWSGQGYDKVFDCQEVWSFTPTITLPDTIVRLEPDLPVTTLGVEATITRVEVSPIGAYVSIEGDSLNGHHAWMSKDSLSGWYACVEHQEITLYCKDGTAIPLTEGIAGSGCDGGTDTSEAGRLYLARRADTLIDLDSLDCISVCGVKIPLY